MNNARNERRRFDSIRQKLVFFFGRQIYRVTSRAWISRNCTALTIALSLHIAHIVWPVCRTTANVNNSGAANNGKKRTPVAETKATSDCLWCSFRAGVFRALYFASGHRQPLPCVPCVPCAAIAHNLHKTDYTHFCLYLKSVENSVENSFEHTANRINRVHFDQGQQRAALNWVWKEKKQSKWENADNRKKN